MRNERDMESIAISGPDVMEYVKGFFRQEIPVPALISELDIAFLANSEFRVGTETMLVVTAIHELHGPDAQIGCAPVVVKVNAEIGLVQDHYFLHAWTIYEREVVCSFDFPQLAYPDIESAHH